MVCEAGEEDRASDEAFLAINHFPLFIIVHLTILFLQDFKHGLSNLFPDVGFTRSRRTLDQGNVSAKGSPKRFLLVMIQCVGLNFLVDDIIQLINIFKIIGHLNSFRISINDALFERNHFDCLKLLQDMVVRLIVAFGLKDNYWLAKHALKSRECVGLGARFIGQNLNIDLDISMLFHIVIHLPPISVSDYALSYLLLESVV